MGGKMNIEYFRAYREANREKLNAQAREYRKSFQARARKSAYAKAHPEINKGWQKRNPEKRRVHGILNDALRRGKIAKPNICSKCNIISAIIDGHHHDYSKPLEVVWLCRPCHVLEHMVVAQ